MCCVPVVPSLSSVDVLLSYPLSSSIVFFSIRMQRFRFFLLLLPNVCRSRRFENCMFCWTHALNWHSIQHRTIAIWHCFGDLCESCVCSLDWRRTHHKLMKKNIRTCFSFSFNFSKIAICSFTNYYWPFWPEEVWRPCERKKRISILWLIFSFNCFA